MAYVKNTWVDREGTTRYHETVDEDGALIFTPDYEKVTEIGTPVNADNMNHIEEGIEDHENRITVLEEGQDTSEFLNTSQITNCILEKPKYLNWTYEGGVITLKTGSKLIYPNGFNSDGSRKFSYHTTTKDITWETSGADSRLRYLWVGRVGQYPANYTQGMLYVGDTAPTLTSNNCLWYDTANNILKSTSDKGVTWNTQGTFPIMTAYNKEGGVGFEYPTSVFDGIGIMDNCAWVADGLKVLVPYGRNSDGTLKNTEITSKASVHLAVWKVSTTATSPLFITTTGILGNSGTKYVESEIEPTFNYVLWYNPLTNEIKYKDSATSTWALRRYAVVGLCYGTYGTPWASHFSYTEPNLKEAFRAVDYNEFEQLSNEFANTPHIVETYVNGASGYIVYSNKLCEQWGQAAVPANKVSTINFLKNYSSGDYSITFSTRDDGRTGDKWLPYINAAPTVSSFVIVNSTSQVNILNWRTIGYIA